MHKNPPCFRETQGAIIIENISLVYQTLASAVMKIYWQKIVFFFCYYFLCAFFTGFCMFILPIYNQFPFLHSVTAKKGIANSLKLTENYLIAQTFEGRVQMKCLKLAVLQTMSFQWFMWHSENHPILKEIFKGSFIPNYFRSPGR